MSEQSISLLDLLDLAIGSPQRAAVNFGALHALLHAVLSQLGIGDRKTQWTVGGSLVPGVQDQDQVQDQGEDRIQEGVIATEEEQEVNERAASTSASPAPLTPDPDPEPSKSTGSKADQQSMLRSRVKSCEDSVTEAMKRIQELQSKEEQLEQEVKELRVQQEEKEKEVRVQQEEKEKEKEKELRPLQEEKEKELRLKQEEKEKEKELRVKQEDQEVSAVETCCHRVEALENSVLSVNQRLHRYPDAQELVTWKILQSALLSQRENMHKDLMNSGVVDPVSVITWSHDPPGPAAPSPPGSIDVPGHVSTLQDQTDPGSGGGAPTGPSQPSDASATAGSTDPLVSSGPSQRSTPPNNGSGGSEKYPEVVEALRNMGKLTEKFSSLEARVSALEDGQVDQSELTRLRDLITSSASHEALAEVREELDQQRVSMESLMSDRGKLHSLEELIMVQDRESSSEEIDSSQLHELRQKITCTRRSVQKVQQDVEQLKEKQAQSEDRAAERRLQDQLDVLRAQLEDTALSLTSKLSGQAQDQEGGRGSRDTDSKLSRLFHGYQHLQRTVDKLLQQHRQEQEGGGAGAEGGAGGGVGGVGWLEETEERWEMERDVQTAILQLRAECERLQEDSRSLQEDNRRKQSHIQELYKTTEELQEKKADKLMVETEIKADKSAIDTKVSRLQFDSVTEQLSGLFHELLHKVTEHEQDWSKVLNRISTEMECKLNRVELDSVKKQLEDRWRNIQPKLQALGPLEHEDAAGLRKQLVDRFHCLSCDRPVVKYNTSSPPVKFPSSPGLPAHRSIRPFTVYALEQFRQHYRSVKPGMNRLNFEAAAGGRMRSELQQESHAEICRTIESVKRRIRQTRRGSKAQDSERASHLSNHHPVSVPRSCGGSYTVTAAGQRRAGVPYSRTLTQTETEGPEQSEQVKIQGLNGQVYKGRLNAAASRSTESKLPTISSKDGVCKTKDRSRSSPSHKPPTVSPDVGHAPTPQPHSARSQGSRSGSSASGRDWPVSALGCPSQSSMAPGSAAEELPDL